MTYVRMIYPRSRSYISGGLFFGLLLVGAGLSWIIGERRVYGLSSWTSFAFMFGTLLLAYALLRRGNPYRVGRFSLALGFLVLAYAFISYFGYGDYLWAGLIVAAGVALIVGAIRRGN